ncbi:MAG: IclR family transcriptional regulator [Rhodococcus sp. (in: high G+C Gram-positive bacteria)]|uniref:IclR family transcriptional regulator n=1 Tax=Rhodococcus sp. TaxID=1831 RepID=UPI003BB21446
MVTQGTTSADRAADILLLFVDGEESLGVSKIARDLELSKAVVHRVLTSFVDRGLLVAGGAERGYSLGPAAAALGARALRTSPIREVARPVLEDIARLTDETATLSAMVGGGRVYLDQIESQREIKMTVELGRRFPLHSGSSGRCILAFLPPEEIEEVLAQELPALTSHTITDPTVLGEMLMQIRRAGYSQSAGERQEDAASMAAPIFDLDGKVVGALSVCGPAHRMTETFCQSHTAMIIAASDRVSRALGWRGGLPDPIARKNP